LALLVSLVLLAFAAACVTPPREVSVRCEPDPAPAFRCESWYRWLWGTWGRRHARVPSAPQELAAFAPGLGAAPEVSFRSFDLDIAYRSNVFGSQSRLRARFGSAPRVYLTDWHPTRYGGRGLEDTLAFGSTLREGGAASLTYRSGWGGLMIAVPLSLLTLLVLWGFSGHTRVVFHPDRETVETTTRAYWLSGVERHSLARGDIVAAFAQESPTGKETKTFRPALRLKSGEVVGFGEVGLSTPARAEHFAAMLREMLELEGPGAPRS